MSYEEDDIDETAGEDLVLEEEAEQPYSIYAQFGCQCSTCTAARKANELAKTAPAPQPPKPRTQKAKGLEVLRTLYAGTSTKTLQVYTLVQSMEDVERAAIRLPAFCRPCPQRPRHGFVESKVVKDVAGLRAMAEATFKADAKGEVMLTPVYEDVKLNSIITPHSIVVGEGHDGATSGRNTITFPLAGVMEQGLAGKLKKAGVGEEEDPYIEAIHFKGGWDTSWIHTLTQLRAGPKGAVVGNYIPELIEVKKVIPAKGDLLEWEEVLSKAEPGTVVYHPGGSPTDHYTAHARTFKVPVVFDKEPPIGVVLEPIPVPPPDPDQVLLGAITAWKVELSPKNAKRAGRLMIAAAHHSGVMVGKDAFWLGLGVGFMIRLGLAALKGEARHCNNLNSDLAFNPDRAENWLDAWKEPIGSVPGNLLTLTQIHRYGRYRTSGFGGEKWAQCGVSLFPLVNNLRLLAKGRGDRAKVVNNLLRAFNIAINQAHNGGWWMNKFVDSSDFTLIQNGYIPPLTDMVPMIHEAGTMKARKSWAVKAFSAWEVLKMESVDVAEAALVTVPLLNGVFLKVSSPMFSSPSYHRLLVPADMQAAFLSASSFTLHFSKGRWEIGDGNTTFWTEPILTPQLVDLSKGK